MRKVTSLFGLTLLLTYLALAQSKDFWEKKDYRQWTDKECHKLLEDSPWASTYTMSQIFFDRVATDTTDRERQQNPKKFLAGRNPDSVVIHVTYSASAQLDDRDLTHYWHTQTTESLKNFTYLIGGGSSRVPLSAFRPGAGEAHEFQFIFPREYNGRPVIGPGDKLLGLEFNHPEIRGPKARVLIQFKVEKMTSQGTVNY